MKGKEHFKRKLIEKLKESTKIDTDMDITPPEDDDPDIEEKKHPHKKSKKEKQNTVLFFKELSEDVFFTPLLESSNSKEGAMAINDLKTIARYAVMARGLVEETDNLPEWLEAKLTIASENMSIVYNYLMNESE